MSIWSVVLYSHCGMRSELLTGELEACRRLVAQTLRARKREGFAINARGGTSWELTEPEGSMMVPDTAGILELEPPTMYRCVECHWEHESRDDAWACCAEGFEHEEWCIEEGEHCGA